MPQSLIASNEMHHLPRLVTTNCDSYSTSRLSQRCDNAYSSSQQCVQLNTVHACIMFKRARVVSCRSFFNWHLGPDPKAGLAGVFKPPANISSPFVKPIEDRQMESICEIVLLIIGVRASVFQIEMFPGGRDFCRKSSLTVLALVMESTHTSHQNTAHLIDQPTSLQAKSILPSLHISSNHPPPCKPGTHSTPRPSAAPNRLFSHSHTFEKSLRTKRFPPSTCKAESHRD